MHVKGLLARSHPGRRGIPPGQKNTAFFYLVNSQPREHGNVVKSTILSSETGGNKAYELEYGGTPWEKPEIYQRLSATTFAKNVNAAVLLLNGENDHKEQPEYYCTWLRRMGKTVEYILYGNDGHQPDKEEHRRDRWDRTLEWFRRYLLDPPIEQTQEENV